MKCSGTTMIPCILCHGEVEHNSSFHGFAWLNESVAQQRRDDEWLQRREGREEVREILLLDRAGFDLLAVSCLDRPSHVFDEQGQVEAILHVERRHDIQVVLRAISPDKDGVGLKDRMGGVYRGVSDSELGCTGRGVAQDKCNRNPKD